MKKRALIAICIGLALILLGSFFAFLFNRGVFTTSVKRISFETSLGKLSGLLYMPKGAGADNPRPTVIVTHGYLNSAEMQDANAIELSRRGYVVLALDQYDHGHSDLNDEVYAAFGGETFTGMWFPFWVNSMHDAVAYMYEQPYVLKDSAGNGIIGVTGHSMGGFGSTMALAMDEQEFAVTGVRKIYCGLTEGSDFSYTGFMGIDAATADALGGGRTMGKVAAQYDEFFFNAPDAPAGTVRHKDYVSTPDGLTFLQQTESAQANTWYETSDGGKRIIYEPAQTHPWNHFSKNTTANAVEFYTEAFKDYNADIKDVAATNQVWQLKELFECVALVGFVFLIIGVASLLIELPFFRLAKSELKPLPSVTGTGSKIGTFALLFCLILLPGVFFSALMDDGPKSDMMNVLMYAGCAFGVAGIVGIILSIFSKENRGKLLVGSICVTIAGAALAVIARTPMYETGKFWNALGINSIAYWTIGCAAIALLGMTVVYVVSKANKGVTFKDYGVTFNPVKILVSLLIAVITFVVAYAVLFLMDLLFKADFRIWTFAFKTFDFNIIPTILKYLPTFLVFYIVSTASITINTNTEKLQGIKGYLLAIALNAGGGFLWLVHQYGKLFITGVAAHPGSALSGIVLVAMIPTLSIAAIISRNLYKKTGNIWTPAFLNALLMTTMTIANTMIAFK
ncbi:MAG: alpha/beta hydrolase [Clostridia bacterium]|jgi:pimeloyl-ACP methyl ester carboxylesterase|nr:alpha/beta hydrolase [Clostridia bacterium]